MSDSPAKRYHRRTKHYLERFARGPDFLDWDEQPEAFRWFEGAERVPLPLVADCLSSRLFTELFPPRDPAPMHRDSLAGLFELSFGLSAWKRYQNSRWALRCNPSSGNLHPTEAYLLCAPLSGLSAGVYHYLSRDHVLERRGAWADGADTEAMAEVLTGEMVAIALTSVTWREAWKYGERAFRYCQLDVGHALAALTYGAACLGWHVRVMDGVSDRAVARLTGVDREADFAERERETPEVLVVVSRHSFNDKSKAVDAAWESLGAPSQWWGQANVLDPRHYHHWKVVDEAIVVTEKGGGAAVSKAAQDGLEILAGSLSDDGEGLPALDKDKPAADLIRQRRSAQQFDGQSVLAATALSRVLRATVPMVSEVSPWSALAIMPQYSALVLFVHRVEGLEPGLYLFVRDGRGVERWRERLANPDFVWEEETLPGGMPVIRLLAGNMERLAKAISCRQEIASHSAFSLAMLADFDETLGAGDWSYRQLFWEAGFVGQVLYLQAEAEGMRGTGIGCFFDDAMHELLGLQGESAQDVYHFTVGGAFEDGRLETLAGYAGLEKRELAFPLE